MLEGYYLNMTNYQNDRLIYPGVQKKIDSHISVLRSLGKVTNLLIEYHSHPILNRLPFYSNMFNYTVLINEIKNPDYLYIRKPIIEKGMVIFLKKIKKQYPQCKMVMELYTYPYDRDSYYKSGKLCWKDLPLLLKEKVNRQKLSGLVDRLITYSDDDYIWGLETIKTINGVDVENIEKHQKQVDISDREIHLISVATMQVHHGYDRVIEGLRDYYAKNPERKVVYHAVGNGSEVEKYKRLVEEYELQDCVIFHGMLTGDDLSKVYNQADLAIASLGLHRIGLSSASTLKSREYMARGIPFVYAGEVDVLRNNEQKYAVCVPADESAINIAEIVNFYDKLKVELDVHSISDEMRDYAWKTVDMKVTFEPIIDFLRKN